MSAAPGNDFNAFTTFVADQAATSIKQSEEIFAIATKQAVSNVKAAQQIALETVGKFGELTSDVVPSLPAWLPASKVSGTALVGFDLAAQVLSAQKAIAQSVLDLFTSASTN
jgi:hypothetical protein